MNYKDMSVRYLYMALFLGEHASFLDGYSYHTAREEYPDTTDYDKLSYVSATLNPTWSAPTVQLHCHGEEAVSLMTAVCSHFGGKWNKETTSYEFQMTKSVAFGDTEMKLVVATEREAVCTRRVIGSETVMEPDYTQAPQKEVTREIVEWDCPPSVLALTGEGTSND